MGVARLSGGYSTFETNANTRTETLVGVAVPFGAVAVGLDYYVSSNFGGTVGDDRSGYALGASYALSKMTNVSASTYSWSKNGGGSNTGFRTFVSKSF
jgi:hypothetical protein